MWVYINNRIIISIIIIINIDDSNNAIHVLEFLATAVAYKM